MPLDWSNIRTGEADSLHGATIELCGWVIPFDPTADEAVYFVLAADAPCCGGCVPRDPLSCVEVFAAVPCAPQEQAITLRGRLQRLIDDPVGWRYQLVDARPVGLLPNDAPRSLGRRAFSHRARRWASQPARLAASRATRKSRTLRQHLHRLRARKHRTIHPPGAPPTR
jgi:membrane dipeptidase